MEPPTRQMRPSGPRVNLLAKTSPRLNAKPGPLNRRVVAVAAVAIASWALAGAAAARLLGWHLPVGPGP